MPLSGACILTHPKRQEDLVIAPAAMLRGLRLPAPLDEAQALIDAQRRRCILADPDIDVRQAFPRLRQLQRCRSYSAAQAAATVAGVDENAPELCTVG